MINALTYCTIPHCSYCNRNCERYAYSQYQASILHMTFNAGSQLIENTAALVHEGGLRLQSCNFSPLQ